MPARNSLERRIRFDAKDLVVYSPVTEKHTGDRHDAGRVVRAAITLSDNTAGNLLLAASGDPPD